MAYRISGLGWLPDPPDFRDRRADQAPVQQAIEQNVRAMAETIGTRLFRPNLQPQSLPASTDLRALCSPIENQETIGSCTAHSVVGLVEYMERSLKNEYLDASRLFLYKVTRQFLGWTGDTGAFVRATIKSLRLFGVPPEEYYPYDVTRFDDDPSGFCFAFAGNYKALQYYRLCTLDDLKQSLARGIPFAFGFSCYNSLFTDAVSSSGDIPFPGDNEQINGGHAVMGVGYNDNAGRLLIRNSWGTGWGQGGYGTLPYEYVERGLASDFWALANLDYVQLTEGKE